MAPAGMALGRYKRHFRCVFLKWDSEQWSETVDDCAIYFDARKHAGDNITSGPTVLSGYLKNMLDNADGRSMK